MIVKFFELNKRNIKNDKYFLLYGNNKGLIEETLQKTIKSTLKGNVFKYDEGELIKNIDSFNENIFKKSFFDNEKLILDYRATDKIFPVIKEIIEQGTSDVSLILISDILEKKSKLRNFFEKEKKTICIPFYEDNKQTLSSVAFNFLKEKKILMSQENINLIVERSRGDRINIYNELEKIENFSRNKKKLKLVIF